MDKVRQTVREILLSGTMLDDFVQTKTTQLRVSLRHASQGLPKSPGNTWVREQFGAAVVQKHSAGPATKKVHDDTPEDACGELAAKEEHALDGKGDDGEEEEEEDEWENGGRRLKRPSAAKKNRT